MPKHKSSRSAAKRFKKTKSGKIKRRMACKSHLLSKKTTKRKRKLRKYKLVEKADQKKIKRLLSK